MYREISHIEESLRQLNLRLDKPRNEGYYLIGSDEDKAALRDQLNAHPYGDLSKAQRQNAIALMVLSGQGSAQLKPSPMIFPSVYGRSTRIWLV